MVIDKNVKNVNNKELNTFDHKLYTRQKKKVGQLKNANILKKINRDVIYMHIFLKLIQFQINRWVKHLKILSEGEIASHRVP